MPRTANSHTGNDDHRSYKKFLKKDSAVIYDKLQALEFIGEITQARHMKSEVIRTLGSAAGLRAIDCCLNIVAEEDPSPRDWEILNKIFVLIANKKLWEGLLKHEIEKISSEMFRIEAFWQRLPYVIGAELRETESISLILCFSECRGILSNSSSLSRTVIDQIVSRVIASPFAGSGEIMMMRNVFLTTNPTEPVSIQNLPSQSDLLLWRQLHDNDHLDDFRKVSSFPTIDELNLPDYPIEYMYRGWRKDESDLCGKHIDRQFRLLRCDMLATLREELKSWRDSQGKVLHYPAPVVIGADFDEGIGVVVNVAFPLPEKVVQLLRSKCSSSKDKAKAKRSQSKFFDEEGRYILPFNTLIIFANEGKQVLATGVVLKRDTSEMMKVALDSLPSSSVFVSVGLQCDDESLAFLLQHLQSNDHSTMAVQMRAAVFNYEPVLEGLKEILNLPLSVELLEGVNAPSPHHIPIPESVRQKLASSRSQYDALVAALTNRVTLIQGPPGTGKTFLGVQLVRTLVPHSRILCICYTNHALDSFLESLLNAGIPATTILRLGSAAKVSERIKPCLPVNKHCAFDQCQRRSFAQIKNEMESYQKELQDCTYHLHTFHNIFPSFKSIHAAIDFVPSLAGVIPRAAFQPVTSDNYRNVGRKGKTMEDTDIFDKWQHGEVRPEYVRPHRVWDLSLEQRTQRNKEWFQAYRQLCSDKLAAIVSTLNSLAANLKSLKDEPRSASFAQATIVACTTSYAAKNRHVLHDTDFDTVLVEEAAEIHESHILVNLKESTKRLIMIGDHKQLRPKLEHYPLRVESSRGIDFDRSMFERLILMGYPYSTLDTQHRMRPEISRYLRGTYPQLLDGGRTMNRENIRGMSRNVAFITHSEPESGGEDSLGLKTLSKTNNFEVEMILSMVKYLLQQGYQKGDIVILTPYLGQLLQLRNAIRQANFEVTVSEQDQKDLLDVGEELDNLSDKLQGESQSIRVATIDNYQGEESKIILASLVRSNDNGEVGFVKGAERVNVLMSRARDGFYLVGNRDTLCSARSSIWKDLLTLMAANGDVVPGFPVHCQHHDKKQFLRSPRDFLDKAPNGGCDALCMEALPTCPRGHRCQQRCHGHSHPNIHRDMKCPEILQEVCPRGHTVQRRCSNHKANLCKISMQTRCPSNHIVLHECHVVNASCLSCQKKQKASAKAAREAEQQIVSLQQEVEALEIQNVQKAEEARVTQLKQELAMRKQQLQANLAAAERLKSKPQVIDTSSSVRAEEKPSQPPSNPNQRTTATTATSSKSPSTLSNKDNGASAAPKREREMPVSEITMDWETMDREALKALAHEGKWDALLPLLPLGTRHLDALWRNNVMSQLPREGILLRLLVAVKQGREDEATPLQYCWTAYQGSPFARTDQRQEQTFEYFALLTKWLQMMICSRTPNSHALVREAFAELCNKQEVVEHMVKAFPQEWMTELRQAIQAMSTVSSSSPQASAASAAPQQPSLEAVADRDHQITLRWEEMKLQLQPTNPSAAAASLSEAMDQLMTMTGLVAIKEQCLSLFDSVQVMKERRETFDDQNLNTRFDGNPGTGKTTVADLLCRILMDLKVLPKEATIFKKTGSELITMGVRGLQQELAAMKGDGGGVVFVDEAYQLNDPAGKAVLDFILGHAERMKGAFGSLVWIFAGYKRHMDDLFKLNPGLPQRFPKRFVFDDYTDEEMVRIFEGLMRRKPTGGASSPAQSKSASEKRKEEAAAEKKKQEEDQRKQANTINMSSNNNMFDNQPPAVDRWGNRWTWAGNRYVDDYGNVSGFDLSTVGTQSNPVVSNLTSKAYVFDENRKLWHNWNDPADSLPGYPGKEAPKAAAEAAPPNPKPTDLTPFTADAKWVRIAIRRIGRRRGVEGFANAREVRNLFDLARERLNARISRERNAGRNPNIYRFERDDLLGPKATMAAFEQSAAWKELNRMDGLQEVKASVRDLVQLVVTNAQREEDEQPLLDVSLNRVFLGNPGTGKTTVARLYARILKDLGLLSKGDIFLKMASDFVGSALGKSEEITRGILTESMGSVLVIDEAYGLYQDTGSTNEPYREAVINTLVEQVQGKPGEDRAVLLLGYRDEMETMMRKCNPGLSRRFQLDQAFEFKDYDDEALKRILVAAVRKAKLTISDATAVFAVKQMSKAKAMPNFGNAGAVDNLLSQAKLRMVRRTTNATGGMGAVTDLFTPAARANNTELLPADFVPEGYTEEIIEPEALLSRANLLGCDAIREKLEEYCAVVKFNKARNQPLSNAVAFNFVFTGAPGTGKTSVARLMGKMFHSLGLLPTDEVMEISASDLMTGYVGQAGKKTREEFTKGRGKVVFVDEAYQLNPQQGGSYAQEVVDEIVKLMTSTDFQNKMIVILAGYKDDMERMLNVNAGLRSRFTEHVDFASFSPAEVHQLLHKLLTDDSQGPPLSPSVTADTLRGLSVKMTQLPTFANGRDVNTLANKARRRAITRLGKQTSTSTSEQTVIEEDLHGAFTEVQKASGVSTTSAAASSVPERPPPQPQAFANPPPPPQMTTTTVQATEAAPAVVVDEGNELDEDATELTLDEPSTSVEVRTAAVSTPPPPPPQLFNSERWNSATPKSFLKSLQLALDLAGWSSQEKIRLLCDIPRAEFDAHPEIAMLLAVLKQMLSSLSPDEVYDLLEEWQETQEDVKAAQEEQEREEEQARLMQRETLVPIWRCAVCGFADQPYIACYVQPFIVRYERRSLP